MKHTKSVKITPHVQKLIKQLVNLPFPDFKGDDNSASVFEYTEKVKYLCIRLKRFEALKTE